MKFNHRHNFVAAVCDRRGWLKTLRSTGGHRPPLQLELAALRRNEGGMITVVFIALLAIMMILVMAESRALIQLRRETKLLEQQQIKRLDIAITNTVTVIAKSN